MSRNPAATFYLVGVGSAAVFVVVTLGRFSLCRFRSGTENEMGVPLCQDPPLFLVRLLREVSDCWFGEDGEGAPCSTLVGLIIAR